MKQILLAGCISVFAVSIASGPNVIGLSQIEKSLAVSALDQGGTAAEVGDLTIYQIQPLNAPEISIADILVQGTVSIDNLDVLSGAQIFGTVQPKLYTFVDENGEQQFIVQPSDGSKFLQLSDVCKIMPWLCVVVL